MWSIEIFVLQLSVDVFTNFFVSKAYSNVWKYSSHFVSCKDGTLSSERNRTRTDSHGCCWRFQEKLIYHFMSPLQKWRYRRIFPWKMTFQIIKIFIVTMQILLFGVDSAHFYKEHAATETALKVRGSAGMNTTVIVCACELINCFQADGNPNNQ